MRGKKPVVIDQDASYFDPDAVVADAVDGDADDIGFLFEKGCDDEDLDDIEELNFDHED